MQLKFKASFLTIYTNNSIVTFGSRMILYQKNSYSLLNHVLGWKVINAWEFINQIIGSREMDLKINTKNLKDIYGCKQILNKDYIFLVQNYVFHTNEFLKVCLNKINNF